MAQRLQDAGLLPVDYSSEIGEEVRCRIPGYDVDRVEGSKLGVLETELNVEIVEGGLEDVKVSGN